jgi:hypothetical protein
MDLSFTIVAGPRHCSHSRVQVSRDTWPYFTVSNWDSPKLEGQVPAFISPKEQGGHPQALGSLFVASYYSQVYGGGIRTRLHTGSIL